MKWIGQHIYDLVSRFRNKVYIEDTLEVNGDLTVNGDNITFESGNADDPLVTIKNTTADNQAARLQLTKDRGAAMLDNDRIGEIDFVGEDASQNAQQYGKIMVQAVESDHGSETGKMRLQVAEYDGTQTDGLILTGQNADGEIDVTIGAGAASTTTVTGTLTMGSTAAMTNAGLVAVANQSNITSLGTLTELDVDDININGKTIEILGDTDDKFTIHTTAAGATTLTTVDEASANGHFEIDADGEITLDANGSINLEPAPNKAVYIHADDNTTIDALNIDCNSLVTGSAIKIDVDDALTASATKSLIHIDYDKSGNTAHLQSSITTGLEISMDDAATSNVGGTLLQGIKVTCDAANADGLANQNGIQVILTDGDTGTNSIGYMSQVEDGGIDFIATSSADGGDYFSIATTTNGATTLATIDDDGHDANFEIAAAGDITLDAVGQIKLEPGTSVLWDSLALTGIQASGESFADNDVSLMTSAAIDDKINTKYSTSYITFSSFSNSSFGTNYIFTNVKGISESQSNQDSGVDSSGDFGGVATEQGGSGVDQLCNIGTANLEQQIIIPETCKLMGFYATTSSYNTTNGTTAGYDTGVAIWHIAEADITWGSDNGGVDISLIHKSDSSRDAMTDEGTNKKKVQKVHRMDGTPKDLGAGDILIPSIFGETSNQQIMATITLVIATPIKTIT